MQKHGLLLASLALCLTGCGTEIVHRERPVPVPVVEYRSPPVDSALLANCGTVPADFATNGELLEAFIEAGKLLERCSAEKAQLRELLK